MVYNSKIYEATNVYDKYKRQNSSPIEKGGDESNQKISKSREEGSKKNGHKKLV